jgi:DNA-binding NarL/FixJ family response regulator
MLGVIVIESQEVVRRGLVDMVERAASVAQWQAFATIEEGVEAAAAGTKADIVLLSSLTLYAAEWSRQQEAMTVLGEHSKIIVLVSSIEPTHLAMVTRLDANGFLLLGSLTARQLDEGLSRVAVADLPLPAEVATYLLGRARTNDNDPLDLGVHLSPRERDVLRLLVDGLTNHQIARALDISIHGAKRHVSSILSKFNSPSRAHLVANVLKSGAEMSSPLATSHEPAVSSNTRWTGAISGRSDETTNGPTAVGAPR